VHTSRWNVVPTLRKDPRLALPILPKIFDDIRIPRTADLVVCSSSGWAHAIATDRPKLVYWHTPARWLYEPQDYVLGAGPHVRAAMRALRPGLLRWDKARVRTTDRHVANSSVVQERLRRVYGIEAELAHPPVGISVHGGQRPVHELQGVQYLLTIARGRGYKNIDLAIRAADRAQVILAVVGAESSLPSTYARGVGRVDDEQLRWLYANSSGLVALAHEDFGLTPLEANAFGRPVLALARGGYLDTVAAGKSGLLLADPPSVDSVADGMLALLRHEWEPGAICSHASQFSPEAFQRRLLNLAASMHETS